MFFIYLIIYLFLIFRYDSDENRMICSAKVILKS